MKAVSRGIQHPQGLLPSRLLTIQPQCKRHYGHYYPFLLPQRIHRPHPNLNPTIIARHHRVTPAPLPLLHIATWRKASTMACEPQYAEGVDVELVRSELDALQNQGWSLDENKIGIKKTFYFKSYFKAVSFVNVIASQSTSKKHHPTMTVRIGSVDIHWTTHHPRGLTEKDTSMAQFCEQAAVLMGAVEEGQGKKCGPAP